MKGHIKVFLKFSIAVALVYWLFTSGKIDFSVLSQSLSYPVEWIICLVCMSVNIFAAALRWKTIIESNVDKKLPYTKYLSFTWIGLLFNAVLPGAVSGDFIKVYYARDIDESLTKTFLLISVFMDRILGVVGLIVMLGVSSSLYYQELISLSPQVKTIIHINFVLLFGVLIFLLTVFLKESFQKSILAFATKVPYIGPLIEKVLKCYWIIGKKKVTIFSAVGLSIFGQTAILIGLWLLFNPFLDNQLKFYQACSFLPIGFLSTAIPITPAGLGVGHVVFDTLFSHFNLKGGASLFNLYFLGTIMVNCIGVIPYLSYGKINNAKLEALESQA